MKIHQEVARVSVDSSALQRQLDELMIYALDPVRENILVEILKKRPLNEWILIRQGVRRINGTDQIMAKMILDGRLLDRVRDCV